MTSHTFRDDRSSVNLGRWLAAADWICGWLGNRNEKWNGYCTIFFHNDLPGALIKIILYLVQLILKHGLSIYIYIELVVICMGHGKVILIDREI